MSTNKSGVASPSQEAKLKSKIETQNGTVLLTMYALVLVLVTLALHVNAALPATTGIPLAATIGWERFTHAPAGTRRVGRPLSRITTIQGSPRLGTPLCDSASRHAGNQPINGYTYRRKPT